uniref:Uncharacterized protein n=1 Tax=Picea glauca TaxID=3330 RepID=A0A124GN37_PICGL|nr:hypothetical protein ABT39_MTgene5769 [Picea glauca]QHR90456.1 hypothetical protein Q903MT_gene4480 [Picea sitchensis]
MKPGSKTRGGMACYEPFTLPCLPLQRIILGTTILLIRAGFNPRNALMNSYSILVYACEDIIAHRGT